MSNSTGNLPFSQRNDYEPVIQKLALGEIPTPFKEELKAFLDRVIQEDDSGYISGVDIYRGIFINICQGSYLKFSQYERKFPKYKSNGTIDYEKLLIKKSFVTNFLFDFIDNSKFFKLFDLCEILIYYQKFLKLYIKIDEETANFIKDILYILSNNKDKEISDSYEDVNYKTRFNILKNMYDNRVKLFGDVLNELFKKHHLAYTIYNGKIEPISSEFEGKAYVAALDETKDTGQLGAHSHLLKAGEQINHQKWADSVRESISAVEAVCRQIVGENATLGSALKEIEKNYPLHPAFKKALSELYGFTSDENGIRHSLLDKSSAAVDEADALFMLGACASFVSYLLSRTRLKDDK